MRSAMKLLAFQIKCVNCGKQLSEAEEWRLGKTSLCKDCFGYIVGSHSLALSKGVSKAISMANSGACQKKDAKENTFTEKAKEGATVSKAVSKAGFVVFHGLFFRRCPR